MEAGRLDRRLQLLRPVRTRDAMNQLVEAFAVEGPAVSASRQDVSDAERVKAQQAGAVISARFQIRRSAQSALIDATWQLQEVGGPRYAVVAKKELLSHGDFGRVVGYELTAVTAQDGPAPADDA